MSTRRNDPDGSYNRILEAVKETHPVPGPADTLFFEPSTGKLVVAQDTPSSRRSAVAAGTLAREGFFGTQ
jgi:hypothetical protein